jgi:1-aminocyclopropane-1-carboxylate deaminase/D-cysteine desulfhydrase-like pyridoxal-dependent ACC family enzyme
MADHNTPSMILSQSELQDRLEAFARVPIAQLPTPLEEAPRLRAALGSSAPRILIKRDDLTGFAFGGNKARHVEFRLPDIQRQGANTLVLANPAQSNHVRMHAALAARFGLQTYILKVPGDKDTVLNGNLLLDHLFGATIVEASSQDPAVVGREMDALIADLTGRGHVVYDVNRAPYSRAASVLSYVSAALELVRQLDEAGLSADHIVMAGSSSAAGMALAGKLLGQQYRVHPVSVRHALPEFGQHVLDSARDAARWLDLPVRLEAGDIEPHDVYVGLAWGVATEGCLSALILAARTEGLVLDPVFTAKAMHALIDQVAQERIGRDETVVFIHTGGQPITFAYSAEILAAASDGAGPSREREVSFSGCEIG